MNIELDEVVGLDVSDEALELAVGGAQGGELLACTAWRTPSATSSFCCC